MRNLKKILAMVLALVMSLSLMATAGAAQFPDVDDSNPYKTAIDVLDELKVFQGFEDGSFKPTDTLNRAQAAVLVYRIATGDVENKYLDNYTYMQQSKFNDLDGYNWAKGYINYCQNAGIVVGTSATTFNPGAPVTGYQLLVMILRTLGYGKAGEFTDPKGWELQTASIAEREGILKNVTGGDFGAPAPRQMVAEILFRGILHDTVEYSPLTPGGYTDSGVSLGKKTLGLDDIEGVVVANRIADLYDNEPMKDGQTRMIVDGKDYVIDMDTDASAIGLNHHAYVQNGKVLGSSLEAEGNVIGEPEHGEAAKVADLAKGAGIKTNADTEYYVNFDEVVSDTSNYRLEYLIGLSLTEYEANRLVAANGGVAWVDDNTNDHKWTAADGDKIDSRTVPTTNGGWDALDNITKVDYLYDKVIPAKDFITATDHRYMKEIFVWSDNKTGDTTSDDLFFGEVYVGTKSTLNEDDISDEISYDEFIEKYINANENRTISDSDNGEWLRVIDNNGDGVAEYVLRTDFIMTTVVDYEKRTDLYNVEYDVDENHKIISKIPAGEIRMDDGVDMSVGAVILYTYIDGYYYISNPEVKTLKVDTKSIEQKKNIFKSDDVEYTWSGIDKEAELYYTDISEISYDVNYDMYFDHFGFVRLATEATRNFVLLTDGYFKTDLRDHEWKVELYNGSEKVETADVVDGARNDKDWDGRRDDGYDDKIDGFIDTYEGDHQGNRGTWKRLNTFGEFYQQINDETGAPAKAHMHYTDKADTDRYDYTDGVYTNGNNSYYADPFMTNIALASETDGVWTLQDVTNIDSEFNSLYRNYKVYELAGTDKAFDDGDSRIKQRSLKAKSTDLWGIDGNNVDDDRDSGWDSNAINSLQAIQTNGSTLYYYVNGKGEVTSWVGYRNLPEGLENFAPARAYAVTHVVWADRDENDPLNYEIADVVVFEDIYSAPVYDPQLITTGINTKRENALGKDSDGEYNEHGVAFGLFDRDELLARAENTVNDEGLWTPQLNFYASNVNKGEAPITEDFAKYGIYAGPVIVAEETKHNDYIEIGARDLNGDRISFYSDDVAAYEINRISRNGDEAAHNLDVETNDNIRMGDWLIVVLAGDDVKMVVNVSASGVDGKNLRNDGVAINKLVDLYNSINHEWANPNTDKYTVEIAKVTDGINDLQNVVELVSGVITESNVKDFTLEFKMLDGAYAITDVKAENATAVEIGGVWHLFNAEDDVKLTVTVQNDNKHSLTQTSGTKRYVVGTSVSLDESIEGSYFTVSDAEGNFYKADGSKWTEADGVAAKFIPTWTVSSGVASVASIKMPAADVIITDDYYGVSTAFDGNKYARAGETVTVTVSSATDTPYWFITYEDGTIVWLDNAKFGTGDQEYVKTGEFTMPAQNVSDTDGRNTYYKVIVDGNEEDAVYVMSRATLDISALVTGDYFGYDLDENGIPTSFKANTGADDAFTVKSSRADENGVINVLSGFYKVTLKDDSSLVERVEGGIDIKKNGVYSYYFTEGESITIIPKADKTFTVNGGSTVYDSISGGYVTEVKGSADLTIAAPVAP